MIRSVTVTNYLGESIKLDLARPELSGFAVKSITGLGPGKSMINISEVATSDGGRFNSARISSRNIVISLVFLWLNNTIEELRHLSYKYFPLKRQVTLFIETDERQVETTGYVESNEPNIFSDQEGTDVSIICPDPYFYSAGEHGDMTTVFSGIAPMFEFPFGNESLTEKLLEMGNIVNRAEGLITYTGDAEIGLTITVHALGEASNLSIYDLTTQEVIRIDSAKLEALTGSGIIAGDDIIICTVKGQKSVRLVRNGITTNIINCLGKSSGWFQLVKGDNIFAYTADEGIINLQFEANNRIAYEGV